MIMINLVMLTGYQSFRARLVSISKRRNLRSFDLD